MSNPERQNEALELIPGAFEEIEEDECWRLLASQPVGRVAVIVGHYPAVFPVNHAVDRRGIVFWTGAGTKLWAIHRSNVTFEVDNFDVVNHTGWSVMVKGSARELAADRNPDLLASAELSAAAPWAPGRRESMVRIVPDAVSGRRIRRSGPPPIQDSPTNTLSRGATELAKSEVRIRPMLKRCASVGGE